MKVKRKRRKSNAPRKWHTSPIGFRYNQNDDGMEPFFLGLAAAEFLPADPATWIDAATDARMIFSGDVTLADKARSDFLKGWLCGTPGAEEAVKALAQARGLMTTA